MRGQSAWPAWPCVTEWAYPAAHPALPGHFPGHPLVPGALLLDQAIAALEDWAGASVTAVKDSRFLLTVGPGDALRLHAERQGAALRFVIVRDAVPSPTVVASGTLALAAA